MKTILISLLILSSVAADELIDTEKIAELLKLPGLELRIEDYTERESKVRSISFKKVAYLRVAGEGYIYPMIIYIASKGAIDPEKYGKMRKLFSEADPLLREAMDDIGSVHFPELDNAVVSIDEIQMTTRYKLDGIEGDPWMFNTPYVGGRSLTATNKKLGLDYQIMITSDVEMKANPELAAKYQNGLLSKVDENHLERMKSLLTLVRDSPMMAAAATKETRREDRRRERPADLRNEPQPDAGMSQTAEKRTAPLIMPLWQWIVSLFVIVGTVVYFLRRTKR